MLKLVSRVPYIFGLCLFFVHTTAWTWPPTFGPEFEFQLPSLNQLSNASEVEKRSQEINLQARCIVKMIDIIKGKVGHRARIDTVNNVVNMGDWSFSLGRDNGIIEVKMSPMTVQQYRSRLSEIQSLIFDSAREADLTIRTKGGNGHINIGVLSGFQTDPGFLIDFLVDYHNHPELATGIMGHDFYNASPLTIQNQKVRDAFARIAHETRDKLSKGLHVEWDILISQILSSVFHRAKFTLGFKGWGTKSQSVNIGNAFLHLPGYNRGAEEARIEIRATRPQLSAKEFLDWIELLEARMRFVQTHGRNAVFNNQESRESYSDQELADAFYKWVAEMGLDYNKYRHLLRDQKALLEPSLEAKRQIKQVAISPTKISCEETLLRPKALTR